MKLKKGAEESEQCCIFLSPGAMSLGRVRDVKAKPADSKVNMMQI